MKLTSMHNKISSFLRSRNNGLVSRHPKLAGPLLRFSRERESIALGAAPLSSSVAREVILHHLRLFGIRGRMPLVLADAKETEIRLIQDACCAGSFVVALNPERELCAALGANVVETVASAGQILRTDLAEDLPWGRLRSLHAARGFIHSAGTAVVTGPLGTAAPWLWVSLERGGVLLIGTDLAADLMRYRQGDPAEALNRQTEPVWGFDGERPMYLFEPQLAGEDLQERPADWWGTVLACTIERYGGARRHPVLPGGAPGAIVVTGDDDQARLSNYLTQLETLGNVPITYFLHPLTKHTPASMAELFSSRKVDLGLHPDALDAPQKYNSLFAEQASWFRNLIGAAPISLRNHGFLNDGYWGHLPSWRAHGIKISSNLPGLNGRVLNGSLLPARMAWDGCLTEHWSVLTAIGDGAVFALGLTAEGSATCMHDLADRIRASRVPGVIVLNLHPDNIAATAAMHHAAREIVRAGFLPWTIRDCFEWFETIDAHVDMQSPSSDAQGVGAGLTGTP